MSLPFALVSNIPSQEQPDPQSDRSSAAARQDATSPPAPTAPEVFWEALHEVNDPELPISIVDMGLVVSLELRERVVALKLTFTAMGCPAMEMIMDDIRARLLREPGVEQVEIEIVWDPPWTPASMSEEGRETLRMWGVSV